MTIRIAHDNINKAAAIAAPIAAQSTTGYDGVIALTGSLISQHVKVPAGMQDNDCTFMVSGSDAKCAFKVGTTPAALGFTSGSSVGTDGTVTTSAATGWPLVDGTERTMRPPKGTNGETVWFSYICASATSVVSFFLDDATEAYGR